jgi:hypothetical protein
MDQLSVMIAKEHYFFENILDATKAAFKHNFPFPLFRFRLQGTIVTVQALLFFQRYLQTTGNFK